MRDHPMDSHTTKDGKPSTTPMSISTRRCSLARLPSNRLSSEMSLEVLVAHCTKELNRYLRGKPYTESYSVELIRRATAGDQEARACVQHCFGDIVLDWIHHHPDREAVCRLKSEESYMAQAFERFWQATASHQRVEYTTLAGVLHCLRVCLQGALLDALRTSERPGEMLFHEPEEPIEPYREEVTSSSEVWEMLQSMLADRREIRLAYLLFHCGLKPYQIVQCFPHEWSDLHEVTAMRRTIMERVMPNADLLRLREANRVQQEREG